MPDTVALSGDELLADLFKSTSTTQTPLISTPPVQSLSSVQSKESPPTAGLPALVPYIDPPDDGYVFCQDLCVLYLDFVYIHVFLFLSSLSLNQLTSHIDHQEQGISSLHEVIPGQLSIDPTVLSEVRTYIIKDHLCNCLYLLFISFLIQTMLV